MTAFSRYTSVESTGGPEGARIRQENNVPIQGQSVKAPADSNSSDLIDGLAEAAALASGMNIEIKNSPEDKEYTWLGVIHANQTASQIRVGITGSTRNTYRPRFFAIT